MYKVCFVTTVSMTLKAFVVELAKFMYDTGEFEIHFVCDYDEQFEEFLPDYIYYHPIPMNRGISFDGIKAIPKMKELFKKEKFDLIQYSTPNASCYASIAAKQAKIPVRLYCQWGIAYVGFQGLKRRIFKSIEKMVCRNSTMIEPDSFGNLNFSFSEGLYGSEKSCVVWNGSASGVNLDKFDISQKSNWKSEIRQKYNIPQDAFIYVFIGRITKDKGINELFEASKRLLSTHTNTYLLLVGNEEINKTVDQSLYKWSVKCNQVIYCGFTNEVEKYLAASDIYVLPSYREGFGSSVIEAEAMGIPVIVSDIPGPTDAMRRDTTGLVVEKGNAYSLHEAMERMYIFQDMRSDMGRAAEKFASSNFEQRELFEMIVENRLSILKQ